MKIIETVIKGSYLVVIKGKITTLCNTNIGQNHYTSRSNPGKNHYTFKLKILVKSCSLRLVETRGDSWRLVEISGDKWRYVETKKYGQTANK